MKKLAVFVFVLTLFSCQQQPKEVNESASEQPATAVPTEVTEVAQPNLLLKNINGQTFNVQEIQGPFALMFFNPDCDHCQDEAKSIHPFKKQFEPYQLYMVSVDSIENIRKFRTDYDLTESWFQFAQGDVEQIINAVGPIPGVPCTFVYNNGKLLKRLEGESKPEDILELLRQP